MKSIIKIGIRPSLRRLLQLGTLLFFSTTAQGVFADNIIYEGVSVPGGFYLGMTRGEVNQIDATGNNSRNCRSDRVCAFRSPSNNDHTVRFWFNYNRVVQIEISNSGFTNQSILETTAGTTSKMSPQDVAAQYPDSQIKEVKFRTTEVIAANQGYTLVSRLVCPPYSFLGPCVHKGTHRIYPPLSAPIEPVKNTKIQLRNLSGARGSIKRYTITVPQGTQFVKIKTSRGSGDVDLYVKKGSAPSLTSYNCRPYRDGNTETCKLRMGPGVYHIMLRGYDSYSGVRLRAYSK